MSSWCHLVIHPQQVPVTCGARGSGWGVGLIIESELHVIFQLLLRWALVLVQQDGLVVTAGESTLVSVDPASRILLLNQISFGLIQTVFVERVAVD